jgi:monovalent cation/hydrogen antiporter
VLGAVLGPTDPVSANAVFQRLGVRGRLQTIVEGESLVNDASSPPPRAGSRSGSRAGWVASRLRAFVSDPSLDVTLSVITPFVAYIPAEEIGASGVLATVTAGVFVGLRTLDVVEPGTRLRTLAFWQSATFLLDGLLFVLIGVQVPSIYHRIEDANVLALVGDALLVTAVVMGVRMVWMAIVPSILHSDTTPAERVAIAWSGMRGGVSLAAALAIPVAVDGTRFPQRDLVIFIAYAVIVITLVVPGLTLAPLLKRLGLVEDAEHRRADADARLKLTHAALERLEDAAEREETRRGPARDAARARVSRRHAARHRARAGPRRVPPACPDPPLTRWRTCSPPSSSRATSSASTRGSRCSSPPPPTAAPSVAWPPSAHSGRCSTRSSRRAR